MNSLSRLGFGEKYTYALAAVLPLMMIFPVALLAVPAGVFAGILRKDEGLLEEYLAITAAILTWIGAFCLLSSLFTQAHVLL
ncbi:MAG: hypothetical protein KW788_03755 [Candidatus Doudnabacteria bacterium]|nr:hypothetical protein [Candidatus Doudnabacteria bacterium]